MTAESELISMHTEQRHTIIHRTYGCRAFRVALRNESLQWAAQGLHKEKTIINMYASGMRCVRAADAFNNHRAPAHPRCDEAALTAPRIEA